MAVNIVTGMTGKAHITSDDDRAKNVLSFGTGKYVMDYGKKFEISILSNNQIRVRDGMCINQGTQMGIELNDYEDVTIENGVSGSNRNDLIVMRYERNADTAIEKASLVVIKGTSGITATDPSYNSGNILDGGDLIDDMPLFRVKIESLSITAVEPLFVVFDYSHRKALAGLSNVDNTSDLNKPVSIATQKAIDDIEIGGRNLYYLKDFDSLSTDNISSWSISDGEITLVASGTYVYIGNALSPLSTWKKNTSPLMDIEGASYVTFSVSNPLFNANYYNFLDSDKKAITKFGSASASGTISVPSGAKYLSMRFGCNSAVAGTEYKLRIKVETGNKPTQWTPAIEDTEAEIQAVDNKLTTNLLKPKMGTVTSNGVTCTNNSDGTYTLNGTASENTDFILYASSNIVELNKEFRLTGCPKNTDAYLFVGDWGNPWTRYGKDMGNGSNFKITTSSPDKVVVINVPKGKTVDNIVFKPMITTNLNATYDDFVPYTGTTGKLNSDVAEIANNLGDASYKGVSNSVLSGDKNLVTGDAVSKAIFSATNYEEGTWTPAQTTSSYYFLSAGGNYMRIGNLVKCQGTFKGVNLASHYTYDLTLAGLPFPVNNFFGDICGYFRKFTGNIYKEEDCINIYDENYGRVYIDKTGKVSLIGMDGCDLYYNGNTELSILFKFEYQTA